MYVLKFKLKYILIILQNLYIYNFFLSDLFYLSHKLVDLYPNDPVSLLFCFVFFYHKMPFDMFKGNLIITHST